MKIATIILAAGKGTRMHSSRPKVLHELSGKPMLAYVLDTAYRLKSSAVHVIHGFAGQQLIDALPNPNINWVEQAQQKGTGHAVMQACPHIADDQIVVILYGDVPLISDTTLSAMVELATQDQLTLLTIELDDPAAMGRIIRDSDNQITAIREFKDASDQERQIKEINTGIMAVPTKLLKQWLNRIDNNNAQQEYYLTDIVQLAVDDGVAVTSITAQSTTEVCGVNSKLELAQLERAYQRQLAEQYLSQGLSIADPGRFDVRGSLAFDQDCQVDLNVIFKGDCQLGRNVRIGAHCIIENSQIDDDTIIEPYSNIENAVIGKSCSVGPYARLRPGSMLEQGSKVGNFVEIKNAIIGKNSKANHLSYIGDAKLGENVNIGAGVITCNYDGANKHQTQIGDNVHIGSDCQLVAPVKVGNNTTVGAGTTVMKDTDENMLIINDKQQIQINGWKRPSKD